MATDFELPGQAIQAALAAGFTRTVLDHAMNPRHAGYLPDADGSACVEGSCLDTMEMWLKVRNGRIEAITFWTDGCGPTIAAGSMVTELVQGKSLAEAQRLTAEDVLAALGGLPEEHRHCARLAVNTLQAALRDYRTKRPEPWKRVYRKE
jgi:nitrogen fixation NifU-like protein